MKHHPVLYRYRQRYWRCYSACICGWIAEYEYTTISGAHLEFGQHLLESDR